MSRLDRLTTSLIQRASLAVKWCVANGTGRIRTHVDCSSRLAVEVLCDFENKSLLGGSSGSGFPQEVCFENLISEGPCLGG